MFQKQITLISMSLLLFFTLFLSGCAQLIQPESSGDNISTQPTTEEYVPAPITTDSADVVDAPDIFVDLDTFLPALLQALNTRDTEKLQQWMTDPFFNSTWRFNQAEVSPTDALDLLYSDQLGTEIKLELVESADLIAMLGGIEPLSVHDSASDVTHTYLVMYTYLVSGWGKEASDAAILFITLEPGDNLKWHGWLQVKGGLSDAWLDGVQAYTNDSLGFSLYHPQDYEIVVANDHEIIFMAPGVGHPSEERAAAFVNVEPANGRTAEQVATEISEDNKSVMGPGYTGGDITMMEIDGEAAYSVGGLTGQDINRRLYVVHDDQLYWMMFVPDTTLAPAYQQMEDLYWMIINTFHWTEIEGGISGTPTGDVTAYTNDTLGFSLSVPKDYEVVDASASEIMFLAPGEGHVSDSRAGAFVVVEALEGRTAEQVANDIAEDNKSVMGPGYTGGNVTVLEIDGEAAYSVDGLTGQDLNRRLYVAHNDQLYWIMFVPDNPNAAAYQEMEDLYAIIVDTFHFTR